MRQTSPRRSPHPGHRPTGLGVVGFHLRQPGASRGDAMTPANIVHAIEVGLPVSELDALQANLGIPLEHLASLLGISKATLHRRKTQGRLDRAESDRVVRFARLAGRAVDVLEGAENARRWLTSIQHGLGGVIPLDYAVTEAGAREVEDLLGRIELGVYS